MEWRSDAPCSRSVRSAKFTLQVTGTVRKTASLNFRTPDNLFAESDMMLIYMDMQYGGMTN